MSMGIASPVGPSGVGPQSRTKQLQNRTK
jgi:hypothetical protein